MQDRAQKIGLFRYQLAREAAEESLSSRERGLLVRSLAAREHLGPDGRWVRVSRTTLDRWVRAYRRGGFDALVPAPRRLANKTPERLLELACALRREQPARTTAQIHRIIVEAEGSSPSARTIQRHFVAAGLPWKGGQIGRALGRFEAESPNELWTGDALHGPLIDGRRTFLFCFLDDHSRLFCGYRWAAREDVLNASRALRAGIAARGVPKAVYVDNGSPFVSGQLLRACAVLGIRLIHSRPGRPEGRGKIERAFRTVREQALGELEDHPPSSLEELNRLFRAGSSRSITGVRIRRPGRRRWIGSSPPARLRSRLSVRCAKRSAGANTGRCRGPARSGCTATPTRSIPGSPVAVWSWSSIRSSWLRSRFVSMAGMWGWRSL